MCKWEIGKHYDLFEFKIIRLLPILFFCLKNLFAHILVFMTNDIMSLCDIFNVVYYLLFFFGFHHWVWNIGIPNSMVSFRKLYGNRNENRNNLLLSEIAFLLFDFNLLVCTVFTSICESWQSLISCSFLYNFIVLQSLTLTAEF